MRLGEGCTEPAKASSDQQIQAIKGIVSEIFFLKKKRKQVVVEREVGHGVRTNIHACSRHSRLVEQLLGGPTFRGKTHSSRSSNPLERSRASAHFVDALVLPHSSGSPPLHPKRCVISRESEGSLESATLTLLLEVALSNTARFLDAVEAAALLLPTFAAGLACVVVSKAPTITRSSTMKLVRRRLLVFLVLLQPAVETIPPLGDPIFWQNHKPSVPVG